MSGFAATLRAGAARRRPLRGLWVTFLGADGLEVVGAACAGGSPALDWVGVDLQHGTLAEPDLPGLLRASPVPVLARTGSADPAHLGRVLDTGVAGIVVPGVESADEAGRIVAAAHPPPRGRRSSGVSRSSIVGGDADPLVLAMVETAAGLADVAAISATDGVDGIFVGPYDLSLSLGTGSATDPATIGAIATVFSAARARGRLTGLFTGRPELAERFDDVDLVAVDSDVAVLQAGLRAVLGG